MKVEKNHFKYRCTVPSWKIPRAVLVAGGHPQGAKRQQVTRHSKRKRTWSFGGIPDSIEKLPSERKYTHVATQPLCTNSTHNPRSMLAKPLVSIIKWVLPIVWNGNQTYRWVDSAAFFYSHSFTLLPYFTAQDPHTFSSLTQNPKFWGILFCPMKKWNFSGPLHCIVGGSKDESQKSHKVVRFGSTCQLVLHLPIPLEPSSSNIHICVRFYRDCFWNLIFLIFGPWKRKKKRRRRMRRRK